MNEMNAGRGAQTLMRFDELRHLIDIADAVDAFERRSIRECETAGNKLSAAIKSARAAGLFGESEQDKSDRRLQDTLAGEGL